LTLFEELLPGAGLTTVTPKLPLEVALPVAVSWVEETNVVVRAVVPICTCAPLTNLVPVRARVKGPVPMLAGLIPDSAGVGFRRVTALLAVAEPEAALAAVIVTVLGFGREEGAV
jgi:hypothetical protein